jgi:hypothetical protein
MKRYVLASLPISNPFILGRARLYGWLALGFGRRIVIKINAAIGSA